MMDIYTYCDFAKDYLHTVEENKIKANSFVHDKEYRISILLRYFSFLEQHLSMHNLQIEFYQNELCIQSLDTFFQTLEKQEDLRAYPVEELISFFQWIKEKTQNIQSENKLKQLIEKCERLRLSSLNDSKV